MQNNNILDKYINKQHISEMIGICTITVLKEEESRMNYDVIYFNHTEIQLNYCYEVFKYWHKNKENFNINHCARETEISLHHVNKIYNKYLK